MMEIFQAVAPRRAPGSLRFPARDRTQNGTVRLNWQAAANRKAPAFDFLHAFYMQADAGPLQPERRALF